MGKEATMNLQELQIHLNIPRDAAYILVNSAAFHPAQKIGKMWQIDEAALRRWIKREIRRKDKYYGTEDKGESSRKR